MKAVIDHNTRKYTIDLSKPIDISIPLRNGLQNPNAFYAESPRFETTREGEFMGSVGLGGNVNYKKLTITPHGNGTHTECVGHIAKENFTINQCLKEFFFFAQLVTIKPQMANNKDKVISKDQVTEKLNEGVIPDALVLRTAPNSKEKMIQIYTSNNPPYLDDSVCKYLAELGIKHLLLDLPSVDREEDEGKLMSHHAFWNYPESPRLDATITEMIYVPDEINDGYYCLNIQIASIESDASPSKPVLFSLDLKN